MSLGSGPPPFPPENQGPPFLAKNSIKVSRGGDGGEVMSDLGEVTSPPPLMEEMAVGFSGGHEANEVKEEKNGKKQNEKMMKKKNSENIQIDVDDNDQANIKDMKDVVQMKKTNDKISKNELSQSEVLTTISDNLKHDMDEAKMVTSIIKDDKSKTTKSKKKVKTQDSKNNTEQIKESPPAHEVVITSTVANENVKKPNMSVVSPKSKESSKPNSTSSSPKIVAKNKNAMKDSIPEKEKSKVLPVVVASSETPPTQSNKNQKGKKIKNKESSVTNTTTTTTSSANTTNAVSTPSSPEISMKNVNLKSELDTEDEIQSSKEDNILDENVAGTTTVQLSIPTTKTSTTTITATTTTSTSSSPGKKKKGKKHKNKNQTSINENLALNEAIPSNVHDSNVASKDSVSETSTSKPEKSVVSSTKSEPEKETEPDHDLLTAPDSPSIPSQSTSSSGKANRRKRKKERKLREQILQQEVVDIVGPGGLSADLVGYKDKLHKFALELERIEGLGPIQFDMSAIPNSTFDTTCPHHHHHHHGHKDSCINPRSDFGLEIDSDLLADALSRLTHGGSDFNFRIDVTKGKKNYNFRFFFMFLIFPVFFLFCSPLEKQFF